MTLQEAIQQVNKDPARSIKKGECWAAVGALVGISGPAAQMRASRDGVLSVIPRERGVQPCNKCGKPIKEVIAYLAELVGVCSTCRVRAARARAKEQNATRL